MSVNNLETEESKAYYLAQLLLDRSNISKCALSYNHIERLLDEEIGRVRSSLLSREDMMGELPEAEGEPVVLSEKVFVPESPNNKLVGKILGPKGNTAKQIELDTGCRVMVRGRGSLRDRKKEKQLRFHWKDLEQDLHVLVIVKDAKNRAKIRLQNAVRLIRKLMNSDGEDELKRSQLIEYAIITGKLRSLRDCPALEGNRTPSVTPPGHQMDHANNVVTPLSVGKSPPRPPLLLPPIAFPLLQPMSISRPTPLLPRVDDVNCVLCQNKTVHNNCSHFGAIIPSPSLVSTTAISQSLGAPVRYHPYRGFRIP